MAYFPTQNQNQQNNESGMNNTQNQQQQQPSQMGQTVAPPPDATTSVGAPPIAPPSQPAKAPSSGQTGFQQYQKANTGTAQNRLGQAVQSNLQKNATQAQGALQRGQTNFQQLMDRGSLQNRDTAVADVTKAATQARNIYTGNLEQDKANYQASVQANQANAAQIAQNKEAETQRIAQERQALQASQQSQYQQSVAELNKQLAEANRIRQGIHGSTLETSQERAEATRNARSLADQLKSTQSQGLSAFDKEQADALLQREQQLGFSDFQKAQAEDRAKAAQVALDKLNAGTWTTGVDADLQQRFSDIINARYSGPQSLRDTGAYDETLNRVNRASDLATMAKTAGGREDLLAQLYGRPGTEYTRGMSRLDAALLNTNRDAMQGIQSQARELGGMREALARANVDTQLSAQNRAAEIANVRQQSRDEFTKQQQAEEALTEGRLDEAIKSGNEFAQYFKDILQGQTGTTNLNPYEAALLGVSSGEGLYNMGADAIKAQQLDRASLISKDEFARQQALASLAGLDLDKTLKATSKYTDAEKAGTQTAADALDVAGTREALNAAEEQFRKDAEAANISGYGRGKASKGNMFGSKSRTATTTIENNVANMLKAAGYDMDSEVGQNVARSILSDKQATANFLSGADTSSEVSQDGTLAGMAQGAAAGASLGSAGGPVGSAIGAGIGATAGGYLGGGTIDQAQMTEELYRSLGLTPVSDIMRTGRDAIATINDATQGAALKAVGLGDIAKGISGALRGIDTGALAKKAKQKANKAAQANLLKNYQNYLAGQGFSNRLGVSATDQAAVDRLSGLQSLLSKLDKTNVKG